MFECTYVGVWMTYVGLLLHLCPPIQEVSDGGMVTIGSSQMEVILQEGHTGADRHRIGAQGQVRQVK